MWSRYSRRWSRPSASVPTDRLSDGHQRRGRRLLCGKESHAKALERVQDALSRGGQAHSQRNLNHDCGSALLASPWASACLVMGQRGSSGGGSEFPLIEIQRTHFGERGGTRLHVARTMKLARDARASRARLRFLKAGRQS